MRALITGATGFIGRGLLRRFTDAVVLTRDPQRAQQSLGRAKVFAWSPLEAPPPLDAFEGVEAIFHLAGDPIADGRWTPEKKRRIHDSRVESTQNLVRGIEALPAASRPKVLISGSAVGYYGSRGDELLEETSAPGSDFLAQTCIDWERAAAPAGELGLRVVYSRTGVVLGQGGALAKMLLPFRLGFGGRLGDGRQWMPWIHLEDVVGLLVKAASSPALTGPLNVTAPRPVTNAEFTRELAGVLHRPAIFPVPAFGLKLAAGDFAEVLLASQRVVPRVAEFLGYEFQFPQLRQALEAILVPSVAASASV